jgi:Coenzyme PQQ synthesis protein D (PqqD)
MVPVNHALSPNPQGVAAEVIDGEAIIINLATGIYYSMEGVGGSMWDLIEGGCSVEEIVSAVSARYDVSRERAEADVRRVAEELVREELVAVSERESAGAAEQELPTAGKLAYDTPELKTYRDMGDLLALDPHLPGMREIPWKEPAEQHHD